MTICVPGWIAVALLLMACGCKAQELSVSTHERQSPAIKTGDNSVVKVTYGAERVGTKVAIRSAFLIPFPDFDQDRCPKSHVCGDFHESAAVYAVVQSIWPEAVLLTAARLEQNGATSKRPTPGGGGLRTLGEQITKQWNPELFLLQPGEIKTIRFEKGIRLDGLMEFFTDDVRAEQISCDSSPCIMHNLKRVEDLNVFMTKKFGKRASLKLTIYEKDYRPLLSTSFRLADGADMFDGGDLRSGNYRLQHDKFIAEAIRILQRRQGYSDCSVTDRFPRDQISNTWACPIQELQ